MKTKQLLLVLLCLLLFAGMGYAQPARTTGTMSGAMRSTTSGSSNGWIHTRSTGNKVIVWGTGFSEILELTPEQTDELQEVIEQLRPPFSPADIAALFNRTRWLSIADMQTRLNQVLEPEQQLLLAEISFQAAGGLDFHFLNDQLLDIVNLTDAQKEQMRRINAEFEAEHMAARQRRGALQPFDWQNATQEERNRHIAAQVADQRDNRESDEARTKQYAKRIIAVLTPEQRERAERLTAEAPALRSRFMGRAQGALGQAQAEGGQQGQRTQSPAYIYVPGSGSWQPGDPLPPGAVQPQPRGNFPRPANQ